MGKELVEAFSREFRLAEVRLGIDNGVHATDGHLVELEGQQPAMNPED
jgi:hypothetical protein